MNPENSDVPKPDTDKPWRPGGGWVGKGWISEDFDKPDPEIDKLFDGPIFPDEKESKK